VQAQGLPRSPADETSAQLNHVVDLQSLDEDRLGEQLSAIWDLEVGQTVKVIAPMAWLPQVRAQRLLRDVYAQTTNPKSGKRFAFDALIVDRKECTNGLG
jgi:hypothetical protein